MPALDAYDTIDIPNIDKVISQLQIRFRKSSNPHGNGVTTASGCGQLEVRQR